MAKRSKGEKRLTRRQLARREREERLQRIILGIAIALGVIVVGVLVYGIVHEVFIEARRPVARVGDTIITTKQFKARQRYERWMTQLQIYQYDQYLSQLNAQATPSATSPTTDTVGTDDALIQQLEMSKASLERQLSADMANVFAGQILDRMIEEELVRQEAARRALTVTDEEIQQRIKELLGYTEPSATQPLTDTTTTPEAETSAPASEDFEEVYEGFKTNVLEATRFPEDDFKAMIAADLLRLQLKDALSQELNADQDQVQVALFTLENEEAAKELQASLNDGSADPTLVIEELQADDSPQSAGYDLPWVPVGYLANQFGVEVEKAAFSTPVGKASPPLKGPEGVYFVVYVRGHETRPLSPNLFAQEQEKAYQEWLVEAKDRYVEYLDWEKAVITE